MESEKVCIKCGSVKTANRCKPCHSAWMKEWRKRNPEKTREIWREYYYKLNPVQYTKLLRKHKNKCAICKVSFTENIKPYIDHDHSCCPTQMTCGKCVRGLLCNSCNVVLGKAQDSQEYFVRMIGYLKKNARQQNVKHTLHSQD